MSNQVTRKIFVTNNKDTGSGSLRNAINEANLNSGLSKVIINPLNNNNITLNSSIIISSNIILKNKSGQNIIIKSIGNDRIFNVINNTNKDPYLKITSKKDNIVITNGTASTSGGAIYVNVPNHQLILKNVTLMSNYANNFGGAIYTLGSLTLIESSIIENVVGEQGGAIWVGQNISIYKCTLADNFVTIPDASNGGSAIFCDNGNCVIDSSSIVNNVVTFDSETMVGGSGAIIIMSGNLDIHKADIKNNTALNSAGIQMGIGNITINESNVKGNQSFATYPGGAGITITLGTVYVSNSEIMDNKTVGMYSGGLVSLIGNGVIKNSKIMRNTNNGPGGGLAFNIGTLSVDDSIVSENVGASLGGGIVNFAPSPGSIVITNSEISYNVLTNAQTIKQTVEAFFKVVAQNMSNMSMQASKSGGSGGSKFIQNVPNILSRLSNVHNYLKILPVIHHNSIGGGGVATLLSTFLTINNSQIKNNFVGRIVTPKNYPVNSNGGAVFTFNADLTITNSSIIDNKATNNGGAIHNGAKLTIDNTILTNNKAVTGSGGAIFNKGSAVILNSEINNNSALINGGAIENFGSLEIIASLISNNTSRGQQINPPNYIRINTIIN